MGDHAACAKCLDWLHKDKATKITASISPAIVVYYHPECYDPWAEGVGHGVKEVHRANGEPIGNDGLTDSERAVFLKTFQGGVGSKSDPVNSPAHYRWLPNGIEVIDITESFGFLLGNVLKYVMRADHKGKPIEDLEKAAWYLTREIAKRKSSEVV